MSDPKITRTIIILRGILAQHRTLRKDWHPRAKDNQEYQAGYQQAKHDSRNIITQAIRDEYHLTPIPRVFEQWMAEVGWRNNAGQVEITTGTGTTREEALDAARNAETMLSGLGLKEVQSAAARRLITDWEEVSDV